MSLNTLWAAAKADLAPGQPTDDDFRMIVIYLLEQILLGGGGGGGAATLHGVVNPNGVVIGVATGQLYINTATSSIWYWDGALVTWVELIGP